MQECDDRNAWTEGWDLETLQPLELELKTNWGKNQRYQHCNLGNYARTKGWDGQDEMVRLRVNNEKPIPTLDEGNIIGEQEFWTTFLGMEASEENQ